MTIFRVKDSGTAKRGENAIEESTGVCDQQDPYVPRFCWKDWISQALSSQAGDGFYI